ncbi:tectonic-like complex member MKS1 [Petromyzon marinus]|uniref:tectonic-like complex member MKS1 n=1 Tax=Petromyzon marinus TaxID=7757 RepID=UPI003F6FBE24
MEAFNVDTGEAVYRSSDPVKNFKLRIRLSKVTSASGLAKHVRDEELARGAGGDGIMEMQSLAARAPGGVTGMKSDDEEEVVTVSLQEKLFSQHEYDLYINDASCLSPLDRQYHLEILKLEKAGGRKNKRIFTYTDSDRFTNIQEQTGGYGVGESSFLSERMAMVRKRRQDRRYMEGLIPKSQIITWEPTDDFKRHNHVISTPVQTMYIMADLGPHGRLGQEENEVVLCTVKVVGNGVITIKPDFSGCKGPYRIEVDAERREVWKYTLDHASNPIRPNEREREQRMYRDLYTRHTEYLTSLVGSEFEMPPPGILRLVVNGEIVSAKDFEYDNLSVRMFVEMPTNWSSNPNEQLFWVTHTCATKSKNKNNVAHFSFPFSFEAFFKKEDESDVSLPHWPTLYMEVVSVDFWHRYRTEGYSYLLIPSMPGYSEVVCQAWRPVQPGLTSELRRFFIGGFNELEDPTYVAIPSTFQGDKLSRYGFKTETTGSITVKLHCIQQSRAFQDTNNSKQRMWSVLDQLGGYSQQSAIHNVLEAFQRARQRMQASRDTLPANLITNLQAMTTADSTT